MIKVGDLEHARTICDEVGVFFNPDCDICISREEQGELVGGVIYQGHTGASIVMHVAAFRPRWINRDLLWAAFHYPFVQLGVKKVFGQVPEDNTKALELNRNLGFKEETRIADVYPEGDMVLMSMYKADCRWLSIKPRGIAEGD